MQNDTSVGVDVQRPSATLMADGELPALVSALNWLLGAGAPVLPVVGSQALAFLGSR